MDALRMKTPPWDIQGIECAVWDRIALRTKYWAGTNWATSFYFDLTW